MVTEVICNACPSSQELEGAEIFGVVEGGDVLEERVRSARETAKRPVGGFCLDGFQTGSMDGALRTQLVTAVTKELPEDKPRSAVSALFSDRLLGFRLPNGSDLQHQLF